MTKMDATKMMREYSREIVFEDLAQDIASAFGYSLHDLRIVPQKADSFQRINLVPGHEKDYCVSIYQLASALAQAETGSRPTSGMHGIGSYAQDITENAIAMLCDCSPLVPNSHHNDCPAVAIVKE